MGTSAVLTSERVGSETQILGRGWGKPSLGKCLKCHRHWTPSGWDPVTLHDKAHFVNHHQWCAAWVRMLCPLELFQSQSLQLHRDDPNCIGSKNMLFLVCRRPILNPLYAGNNSLWEVVSVFTPGAWLRGEWGSHGWVEQLPEIQMWLVVRAPNVVGWVSLV